MKNLPQDIVKYVKQSKSKKKEHEINIINSRAKEYLGRLTQEEKSIIDKYAKLSDNIEKPLYSISLNGYEIEVESYASESEIGFRYSVYQYIPDVYILKGTKFSFSDAFALIEL